MPDTEDPVYDTLAALLGEGDISLSFEEYSIGQTSTEKECLTMKNLESKFYKTDSIEIRCCKCNMKLMEYTLQHDDDALAINGMSFKCSRCRRVITLMKYTEAIMKQGNILAHDRLVKMV